MENEEPSAFRIAIGMRIQELMDRSDLTAEGFAAYLTITVSALESVLNGTAIIPNKLLHAVTKAFGIRLKLFLDVATPIPVRLTKANSLLSFKKLEDRQYEYFVSKAGRSDVIKFIYEDVIYSDLLAKPAYMREIRAYAKSKSIDIPVHLLIKYLEKLVDEGLLVKNMALLQHKDRSYGKREVAVYSRNKRLKK